MAGQFRFQTAMETRKTPLKMDRELIIPEVAEDDPHALEILRAWIARGKQHVSMRVSIWDDPGMWGVFLADLARHVVNAYVEDDASDPQETLKRVRDMFNAELTSPTDAPQGSIRKQRIPHRRR